MDKKIINRYTDPEFSSSFSGLHSFSKRINTPSTSVKDVLNQLDAFTLHRPVRKNFLRRRVICDSIDKQWHSDLIDLKNIKKQNQNYQYLLTVIDCFSKWGMVVPVKNKCASTVAIAFENILIKNNRFPKSLQVDMGKEFYGSAFKNLMKKYDINMFSTFSEIKNSVCERFNRTILDKLSRYWTYSSSYNYVKVLSKIVQSYNSSYHRSIKMSPNSVNKENEMQVFNNLFPDNLMSTSKAILKPNDICRIARYKNLFDKGYKEKWSRELYKIVEVKNTYPHHYLIESVKGEEIKGGFYDYELQKVSE